MGSGWHCRPGRCRSGRRRIARSVLDPSRIGGLWWLFAVVLVIAGTYLWVLGASALEARRNKHQWHRPHDALRCAFQGLGVTAGGLLGALTVAFASSLWLLATGRWVIF